MRLYGAYPFLYLLAATAGGILSGEAFACPWWVTPVWLAAGIAAHKRILRMADVCIAAAFFCLGNTLAQPDSRRFDADDVWQVNARCEEELAGNNYILSWGGERIFLSRFHADTLYHVGDSLAFKARVLPFRFRENPQEFSYARYLEKQGVTHRFLPAGSIAKTGHARNRRSFFRDRQAALSAKAERLTRDTVCAELMKAIGLGYKYDVPGEVKQLFIDTGTVHLLAVSGLHVGMIYGLLVFLIGRIRTKRFHPSHWTIQVAALPFIWLYACLTGLSPSVVRASLILSLFALGNKRELMLQPLNLLGASACLALWANPRVIYSLSFLLSYSAYAGILTVYPYLTRLPGRLHPIPKRIFAGVCVTVAAQLATLPIGAYFFHTANLNGVLSNVIAVPIASCFLYVTTACLMLPEALSLYLMPVCEWLSRALVWFLHTVSPLMVNLRDLYPTAAGTVLWYVAGGCTLGYLAHQQRGWFHAAWISLAVMLGYSVGVNLYLTSREEVVIFHHYRQSAILVNERGYCFPLKNTAGISEKERPYVAYHRLQPLPETAGVLGKDLRWLPPCLYYGRDTILLPDGRQPIPHSGSVAVITGGVTPQEVFGEDFREAYPPLIVADGSNRPTCVESWRAFCAEHRLRFYHTGECGAIRLNKKR